MPLFTEEQTDEHAITATQFASSLRELADFVETHPSSAQLRWSTQMFSLATEDLVEDFDSMDDDGKADARRELVRTFVRALSDGCTIDNPLEKDMDYRPYGDTGKGQIRLQRNFGPLQVVATFGSEGVCQLVPTGETKTETHYEIPKAVEKQFRIPDEVRKLYRVEVEVPVLERRCPDSLLNI